jgi:hypothetical protein
LRILERLINSEPLLDILSDGPTHDATLKLVAQLAMTCDDDALIEEVVAACFREDYAGDSLDELPRMLRDARNKLASGRCADSG